MKMHSYTYNNHLTYSFLNGFSIDYGKVSRNIFDWRTECVNTARLIRESTSMDIVVFFSGGIDSEIVCRSFIEANIPIKVKIARFDNDRNKHDIRYAISFCEQFNLDYEFEDLQISNYFNNIVPHYANKYQVYSTHMPLQMWLMEHCTGYPVIAEGDLELRREENTDNIFITEKQQALAPTFLLQDLNKEGCPRFFKYNPENMLSFLDDKLTKTWIRYAKAMRMLSITYFKPVIFSHYWPDIAPRQKYTGFEQVQEMDHKLRSKLKQLYEHKNQTIKISLAELYGKLT